MASASKDSTDAELIALAKTGSDHAFTILYERHLGAVYRFCLSKLGSPAEAEDAASEVFLKLVQALPRYDERGLPFGAFLFRIARNAVIDQLRRRKHRPDDLDALTVPPLSDERVDLAAETLDDRRRLIAVLGQLPDAHREVLMLRFVEGRSAEEVGRILGKNEAAVRSLQHRALEKMRELLGQDDHRGNRRKGGDR